MSEQDIQAWWGDLYRQAYENKEPVDLATVDQFLQQRQHLAAVEMPSDLTGKRVLEVGSGAGAHAAIFKARGAEMVAVDITFARAKSTGDKIGRAAQAHAERLPFADNTFDIVYSNGVLHHSIDTQRCIDEVHRVLKPGGRAIIMLYSRSSMNYWLNLLPRGILTGRIFIWPEEKWIARYTEGRPQFGQTWNPITRVYSRRQMLDAFRRFRVESLRKASFEFNTLPLIGRLRRPILRALGYTPHPGGIPLYGEARIPEPAFELWLGRYFGFAWNIVAVKE